MSVIKCKMCGGDLELIEGGSVAVCEYCGSQQTVPAADNEKKLTLFARANRLRLACEFDKAAGVYESIVADFPTEAEAYWGLVLCRYGIEYVDDPATGKKIPTCHRSSFDSVMEDSDFEQALENADAVARRVYRDEAKAIEELRRGIVEVSGKEPPYDIFICYKETAEDGQRTVDSVIAQDVYDALTEKGYRVFFSRISLEDKLGTEYEPYIFAALHSAKIMLAFGTDYEYYNAVWVKNEWSRYLQLMTKDKSKHLIPCYKGIDAYDMPKEFAKLQAQDMGKVGAMQDLLRGVDKIMGRDKAAPAPTVTSTVAASATVESLLKRIEMFLEDGDWDSADEYCEKVLDITPENAQAYLYKLMVELEVHHIDELQEYEFPFDERDNYHKVMRFGDERLKAQLTAAIEHMFSIFIERILKEDGPENFKSYSDYTLSKALCITQARVSNLKVRKELVYPYEDFSWKKSFELVSKKATFENGKIKIYIPDKNLFLEIKNAIEEAGGFVEIQLTSNLLQVKLSYFLDLILAIDDGASRSELRKKIIENTKRDKRDIQCLDNEPFGKALIKQSPELIIDLIGECIPIFGGIAKTIASNLYTAIKASKGE